MIYSVEKISDVLKLFEDKLKEAVLLLNQKHQLKVEQAYSIEDLRIDGPVGTLFILYLGSAHKPKEMTNNAVITDRDITIGVVVYVNYFSGDEYLKPSDYIEFIYETICGIEVENHRLEYQRKIYPKGDELLDEEKGKFKYLVRFGVPGEFWEKSINRN